MDCSPHSRIDLHVHSTASDGTLSPRDILAHALRLKIRALAITDHDTLDGTRAALAEPETPGLNLISGVEISAARPPSFPGPGSLHLLGYGFRLDDPELNRTLLELQAARRRRNPDILRKLAALGIGISESLLAEHTEEKGQTGRPHIAAALVASGVVGSINEAFDRYLGTGKPAYVDKYRVECAAAIRIILNAGGVPVLAHPKLVHLKASESIEALVLELKSMGCRGIEAYYPEHGPEETARFVRIAESNGLLITGGTDFHGAIKPDTRLGGGSGDFFVPYELFERLTAAVPDHQAAVPSA